MALKLQEPDIKRRLHQLRNYERLYPELRAKYEHVKRRIRELKVALACERRELEETVEALKLQIEDARSMTDYSNSH